MNFLLFTFGFGGIALMIINIIVYFVITRKYNKLYPDYLYLSPVVFFPAKQFSWGSAYTFCILFNPKSKLNKNILDLTNKLDFPMLRTRTEIVLSVIHFILSLLVLVSLVSLIVQDVLSL